MSAAKASSPVKPDPDPVTPPDPSPPDPTPSADPADKGVCDNHPDKLAVLVTDFAWAEPQRLCAQCVPSQYKHLL